MLCGPGCTAFVQAWSNLLVKNSGASFLSILYMIDRHQFISCSIYGLIFFAGKGSLSPYVKTSSFENILLNNADLLSRAFKHATYLGGNNGCATTQDYI